MFRDPIGSNNNYPFILISPRSILNSYHLKKKKFGRILFLKVLRPKLIKGASKKTHLLLVPNKTCLNSRHWNVHFFFYNLHKKIWNRCYGCTYNTSSPEGGGPFVKIWHLMSYFRGSHIKKIWQYCPICECRLASERAIPYITC